MEWMAYVKYNDAIRRIVSHYKSIHFSLITSLECHESNKVVQGGIQSNPLDTTLYHFHSHGSYARACSRSLSRSSRFSSIVALFASIVSTRNPNETLPLAFEFACESPLGVFRQTKNKQGAVRDSNPETR